MEPNTHNQYNQPPVTPAESSPHSYTPHHYTATENKPPSSKKDGLRVIMSTLGLILAAFMVAFIVMFFVFRSYQVEGPSMEPTLQNSDRLIIWKMPRTWARLTGHTYIPNRGDVIVFVERGLIAPDGSTKQLIKRVIGLPGDRVVVKDGIVTVFNKAHPDGFIPDTTLPYGKGLSLKVDANENIDETVAKNEVYVMGDNRNNSLDSRVFGPVNADDIVGKLVLRMFPITTAERF